MLEQSQRNLDTQLAAITAQLSAIVAQLERQADSTFSGQSWAAFSDAGFDDKLIPYGKTLIELGERLKSGALPQWKIDQTKAFENCALGQLSKDAGTTTNEH